MALSPDPHPSDVRHVHLDAVGGVAGDMFAAAMLDALPMLRERVLADVAAVLPHRPEVELLEPGESGGLAVLRFGVGVADHLPQGHHGNSYTEIVDAIGAAPLRPGTAARAIAMLRRLGEAEAMVHDVSLCDVHFHEVGAWDSVMDMVAAGSIVAALPSARWSVSDLPRGGGIVRTEHGMLPVPAPATALLLRGFRLRDDGVSGERVTPTGAAILAELVADPSAAPEGHLAATGLGAGTRELRGMPNVLRALVFAGEADGAERVAVVSFDIDDMTGEEIGIALDRLRAVAGMLDVSVGTRLGKKGRPITDFRLLAVPSALAEIRDACFRETSTIGLRWRHEERACLPRSTDERLIDGQVMRVKRAARPGAGVTSKIESDDVAPLDGLARRRRVHALAEDA